MRLVLPFVALFCAFAQSPYNEKPSYGRSRNFDLQHLKLDLSFDLARVEIKRKIQLQMLQIEIAASSVGWFFVIRTLSKCAEQRDKRQDQSHRVGGIVSGGSA